MIAGAIRRTMNQRCVISRRGASGDEDSYGETPVGAYTQVSTDNPCHVWSPSGAGMTIRVEEEYLQYDWVGTMPTSVDVRVNDHVADVTLRNDVTWVAGPLLVKAIRRRHGYVLVLMNEVENE